MTPLVSICIFTYNHEKYIEKCIESALMQKTSFPFEIIIGEDYSKDSTKKICQAYLEKYPEIVRILDRGGNIGMCRNIFNTMQQAKGKYIAMLDGDDYWIDPLKLEKQYQYLEAHPECSLVFHDSIIINELNNRCLFFVRQKKKPVYDIADIMRTWSMATGAMFFRTENMAYPEFVNETHNFDLITQLLVMRDGSKAGYIDDVMSVYRINAGSNTNNPAYSFNMSYPRFVKLYHDFDKFTDGKYHALIENKLAAMEKKKSHVNSLQYKLLVSAKQYGKKLLKK